MINPFRLCAIIPTYDNPITIRPVLDGVRRWIPDVVVVDDGSCVAGRMAVDALTSIPGVHVHHRRDNGGKGAAVKDGFRIARELGFTHALQVDADGQHSLEDIPLFLDAARDHPHALVLGAPRFDASAPRLRRLGRQVTRFWTTIETYGRRVIQDPMCGFRIYPLDAAIFAEARGDAMDFDPEIAVRMVWRNVPVINLPTRVRYLAPEDGGVSHFRAVRDDLLIAWMHTRLVFGAVIGLLQRSR